MKRILLVIASCFLVTLTVAQPQWRFHLAFEDATGTRDTIWLVWDVAATLGSSSNQQVDEELGEGAVDMDLDAFNVWTGNWNYDSTKTHALPYSIFPIHNTEIHGFNYEFPLTISWDNSLFSVEYLPDPTAVNVAFMTCEYFFWNNNCSLPYVFDMLLDSEVTVDGPDAPFLFPLGVVFQHGSTLSVQDRAVSAPWFMQRNDMIAIDLKEVEHVQVLNAAGQVIFDQQVVATPVIIDTEGWPAALYLMRARTSGYQEYHGRVFVAH